MLITQFYHSNMTTYFLKHINKLTADRFFYSTYKVIEEKVFIIQKINFIMPKPVL